jgi:hypothetical protein
VCDALCAGCVSHTDPPAFNTRGVQARGVVRRSRSGSGSSDKDMPRSANSKARSNSSFTHNKSSGATTTRTGRRRNSKSLSRDCFEGWTSARKHHPYLLFACSISVVILALFATLSILVPRQATQSSAAERSWLLAEEGIPSRARELSAQVNLNVLHSQSYYIALNLFNSEDVIEQITGQLLLFAHVAGPANVFVSIYENGRAILSWFVCSILIVFICVS